MELCVNLYSLYVYEYKILKFIKLQVIFESPEKYQF